MKRFPSTPLEPIIELRVERISQLFDMMDPFPFRERDLDKKVENYVVGWARELPTRSPLKIVIHLPDSEANSDHAVHIEAAFHRHFQYSADQESQELRELFRQGRFALAVGLCVLAAALAARAPLSEVLGSSPGARFAGESLIILAWVANWKPIEIFLYDWWPIVRRRRLYRRLASIPVEIKRSA